MAFFLPTEDDVKVLRALIEQFRQTSKTRGIPLTGQDDPPPTPQTYLVQLPEGGIGALDPTGDDPVAGKADCLMCRCVDDGSGNFEIGISDYEVRCLNAGGPYSEQHFAIATRDKFGRWWITKVFGYGCVRGLTKGFVTSGATSFNIDNVVTMQGVSPLADPDDTTEELEVQHITGLPTEDNALTVAWFDNTSGDWYGIPWYKRSSCS